MRNEWLKFKCVIRNEVSTLTQLTSKPLHRINYFDRKIGINESK